jgi:hypothetical protein
MGVQTVNVQDRYRLVYRAAAAQIRRPANCNLALKLERGTVAVAEDFSGEVLVAVSLKTLTADR